MCVDIQQFAILHSICSLISCFVSSEQVKRQDHNERVLLIASSDNIDTEYGKRPTVSLIFSHTNLL